MSIFSRRDFLRTGATAAAETVASPLLSRGWYGLSGAELPGYFEREFGVSDALCRKVLAEALARGGDYADLYFEHTISNNLVLEDSKVNRAVAGGGQSAFAMPVASFAILIPSSVLHAQYVRYASFILHSAA